MKALLLALTALLPLSASADPTCADYPAFLQCVKQKQGTWQDCREWHCERGGTSLHDAELFNDAQASGSTCGFTRAWFGKNLNSFFQETGGTTCRPVSSGGAEYLCSGQRGEPFRAVLNSSNPEFIALEVNISGRTRYCYEKTNCIFGHISDDVNPARLSIGNRFALKDQCLIDGN